MKLDYYIPTQSPDRDFETLISRLIEHKVMNTTLRRRVILEKCEPEMVGNGICNCACQHPSTGNDGGDCDDVTADVRSFCTSERIGDGK